jgi:prepilin-type N-terminal cleavage/methylation domain-containing protein
MKTTGKSAFTLLELIVVIGIIGLLMGVALSQFGGSTESAKAAKCETNMRNLVTAAHTCAMEEPNGFFPPAGSFSYRYVNHKKAKVEYHNYRIGWIAGSENRRGPNNDGITDDAVKFAPIPFNADELSLRNALTNGSIWKAMGGARSAYQCPVHAAAVQKVLTESSPTAPGWSYAMNMRFGNDDTKNNHYSINKEVSNASRLLMFAELQGAVIDVPGCVLQIGKDELKNRLKEGAPKADAVLDYTTEVIGFNHKLGKRGMSGHVAFTDGHIEKLLCPKSGGLSLQKLTEALCLGHEISYDGKGYTDLQQ